MPDWEGNWNKTLEFVCKKRCRIWNCTEQISNFITDKNPFLSGTLTYDFITRESFDW